MNKTLQIENTAGNNSTFKPQEITLYIPENVESVEEMLDEEDNVIYPANTFFRVQADRKEIRPNDLLYLGETIIIQTDYLAISPAVWTHWLCQINIRWSLV